MKLEITETVLRDANQSLIATRLPVKMFEPILTEMDKAGYYSVECWGGATFDVCLRHLDEDPWERLKTIKKYMPKTKLQMLLRGQSLVGYKHYPDDVVRQFVRNSVENGIDIIRIFDALNDLNNIYTAVDETLKCNAHPSCAISYTKSPVHSIDSFVEIAKNMERMGAQSICIKDMAGILAPDEAYRLISLLKDRLTVPIVLHSHCTAGLAYMTYYEAIRAGVDIIDSATSSLSGGTSQPSTSIMIHAAKSLGRETGLNREKINAIDKHFYAVREEFEKKGKISYKTMMIDTGIIESQIPGGMYSNLMSQLSEAGMEDKFEDVLQELPIVRKDLGYPPLVTPLSQMVGVQSVVNVVSGKRYSTIIKEIRDYFEGKYGCPPGEVNKELMKKITGSNKFPNKRYAAGLEPVYENTFKEYADYGYNSNEILSLIMYPVQAKELYKKGENPVRGENYSFIKLHRIPDNLSLKEAGTDDETLALLQAIIAFKENKEPDEVKICKIFEEV